jgi:site-specific recombinase XerD
MGMSNIQPSPDKIAVVKRVKKMRTPTVIVPSAADVLMRPTHEAPAAAERFERFICWTLSDAISILARPQLTIATVLSLEGLVSEQDLLACLLALPSAVRRDDDIQVAWTINDLIGRRNLSALTVVALGGIDERGQGQVNWTQELDKFTDTLRQFYPGANKLRKSELLPQALFDASAWLYLHCPMACFAYLSGKLPLSLLPDSAHDRKCGWRIDQKPAGQAPLVHDLLAEAKDVALEKAFDDSRAASHSRWIIGGLKTLVSDTSGPDGVRSADYIARDKVRYRLGSVCATLARSGTPVDALLLAWVLHLLESGSVRLRNPKVSTITRYVHAAVERLHGALDSISVPPADLDQDAWERLLKNLLAADDLSSEARCALASFHWFLVSEFGLDPVPWMFRGVDEVSVVAANVVWPHEIRRAFELMIDFGLDERLRQMMQVMLALGADNKLRIGEVRSLRLSSLRLEGDDLLIEIAPRRSHHSGKSPAARRILSFRNAEHRLYIKAWLHRREDESAEPGDLLFGDPHQPDKGYKLGACQRLLNQILRSATADPEVSFHSLRHSVICRELLKALMTAAVHHTISSIQKTAVESGHRHESTTFINYFHMPEEPIRFWIDKAVAAHLDSPAAAAKWLGKPAATLRQGRLRAGNQSDYLPRQLRMLALSRVAVALPVATKENRPAALPPRTPASIPLNNLARLLQDLKGPYSMTGLCSRNSVDEVTVVRVCRGVASVVADLEDRSRRSRANLSAKANAQACLDFARTELQRADFCFSARAEPYLLELARQLEELAAPSEGFGQAATAWTRCLVGDVVSLMHADSVRPLIELMQHAAIGADHLVVRVQVNDPNDLDEAREALDRVEVTAARALIEASYQAGMQIECVQRRGGRPDAYLVLSRMRTGAGRPMGSATCRMNRFHGLLFTLAVWVREFHDTTNDAGRHQ